MSLPQKIQRQFSPEEIEFIAGMDMISIIPNFTMDRMDFIQVPSSVPFSSFLHSPYESLPLIVSPYFFIQASYGPFIPPLQAEVPLWLAVALKKNRKCTIVPPEWFTKGQSVRARCKGGKNYDAMLNHVLFTTVDLFLIGIQIDNLQSILQNEEERDEFQEVPFHYMEIAHMLLDM
jgi:GINS complex subunit 2